jgi:alpha-ketoglutarate-dependent 2,4-dichlorophenoxyacetate dioxygenase
MRSTALHPRFGAEVHDVDLRKVSASRGYAEIRAAFEEHSLLLFRHQQLDDAAHLALGKLFGPIEDRAIGSMGKSPRMDNVTNRLDDGSIAAADDLRTIDLMGNQLWHTDSIFLPLPALANILAARVLSSSGGETEFASTREAWRELSPEQQEQLQDAVFRHQLSHSRQKLSAALAEQPHITRFDAQAWKAVWRNPVNGARALYFASHTFAVDGMESVAAQALIEDLTAHATEPRKIYTHRWQAGDVLIWDERALLHRGRPWPYEEERTLASVCVTATDADGIDTIRI